MLHFTAFWKHKVPNNAVKWGEKSLILRKKPAKWRDFVVLEQVTGLEPVISAWKANVLPLHYTCLYTILSPILKKISIHKQATICPLMNGAGDGARTRHLSLGKAALYQMSYSRRNTRLEVWCGRRDLNPYALRHQNLNLARLPIPPHPHTGQLRQEKEKW